jgi:hypothetical protein
LFLHIYKLQAVVPVASSYYKPSISFEMLVSRGAGWPSQVIKILGISIAAARREGVFLAGVDKLLVETLADFDLGRDLTEGCNHHRLILYYGCGLRERPVFLSRTCAFPMLYVHGPGQA